MASSEITERRPSRATACWRARWRLADSKGCRRSRCGASRSRSASRRCRSTTTSRTRTRSSTGSWSAASWRSRRRAGVPDPEAAASGWRTALRERILAARRVMLAASVAADGDGVALDARAWHLRALHRQHRAAVMRAGVCRTTSSITPRMPSAAACTASRTSCAWSGDGGEDAEANMMELLALTPHIAAMLAEVVHHDDRENGCRLHNRDRRLQFL